MTDNDSDTEIRSIINWDRDHQWKQSLKQLEQTKITSLLQGQKQFDDNTQDHDQTRLEKDRAYYQRELTRAEMKVIECKRVIALYDEKLKI